MAQVEGSGTALPLSENEALKVGPLRRWAHDVRANAQPVGIKDLIIAGPTLQVPNERPGAASDRFRRRQPEEIAVGSVIST